MEPWSWEDEVAEFCYIFQRNSEMNTKKLSFLNLTYKAKSLQWPSRWQALFPLTLSLTTSKADFILCAFFLLSLKARLPSHCSYFVVAGKGGRRDMKSCSRMWCFIANCGREQIWNWSINLSKQSFLEAISRDTVSFPGTLNFLKLSLYSIVFHFLCWKIAQIQSQ